MITSLAPYRPYRFTLIAVLSLPLLGCDNTLVYGESTGFNLSISADAAQATPFEANAGLKRRVVGLVPPLQRNQAGVPQSEASNLVGSFKVAQTQGNGGPFDTKVIVASAYATGPAAVALVDGSTADPKDESEAAAAVKNVAQATTIRLGETAADRKVVTALVNYAGASPANRDTYLGLARAQGIPLASGGDAATQATLAISDPKNAEKNALIAKALKLN